MINTIRPNDAHNAIVTFDNMLSNKYLEIWYRNDSDSEDRNADNMSDKDIRRIRDI